MKLGTVCDETIFRTIAEKYFTWYYRPLIGWVNELREAVFPSPGTSPTPTSSGFRPDECAARCRSAGNMDAMAGSTSNSTGTK